VVVGTESVSDAEKRLANGDFGRSVLSGEPIPDERLDVMPTAELTVAEASAES
jgi:DnaK suppressor protein